MISDGVKSLLSSSNEWSEWRR